MSLRNRCKALYQKIQQDAMFRQGSPVDDLMTFVIAERGRAADDSLAEALPLCLYFGSDHDREEIVALVHEVKPNTIAKRMP
jgi:hypothetical protein